MLAGSVVLVGCEALQDSGSTQAPPFVFRSLDMRQKRPNGERNWDLKSPEARYEFSRRLVKARRPEAILYRNNQPNFEVKADRATVINDGELVLLEGKVEVQQLQGRKVLFRGDRLRWIPPKSLLVMEQRPEAIDQLTRVRSTTARLHQITQDLTLFGTVQLERWRPDQRKANQGQADTVVGTRKTLWNLGTGELTAQGPVLGQRRGDNTKVLQQLHAQSLKGNTKDGFIDLIAPVQVLAPDRKGKLDAATTRWLMQKDALYSPKPFQAKMQDAELQGTGFRIAMGDSTVTVLNKCQLNQPGEQLTASICRWNWATDRVAAQGNVELRRKANQQITRSERLTGRVGKKGTVVFSSPEGSVKSQLNIKDDPSRPPSQNKRRPSRVSF